MALVPSRRSFKHIVAQGGKSASAPGIKAARRQVILCVGAIHQAWLARRRRARQFEQTALSPSGKARPLEINILTEGPSGSIEIKARKVPHHFVAEATLFANGQAVARGSARVNDMV